MLIETLTGNQNFPGKTAKVYAFIVPTRANPIPAEVHIHAAAKDGLAGVTKVSGGGRIMACDGMTDSAGAFSNATYNVPDGTLIKLFASKKTPSLVKARQGTLFLRMREGAALQRIMVPLNDHPGATVTTAYIEGAFDVLSVEDGEALGAKVMPLNRQYFFASAIKGLITRRVIRAASSAKPVVETRVVKDSEGNEVQVATRGSRRMLDV